MYYFSVTAYDAFGKESAYSLERSKAAPVAADVTPPVISSVNVSNITSVGGTITWSTNEPADTQVQYGPSTAYGSASLLGVSLGTVHSQILGGLQPSTLYHYRVLSRDAAGNLSISAGGAFTTAARPDILSPSAPGNLSATAVSSSQINLVWNASTDNVAVAGYRIYRNGIPVGASSAPSYSDTGLVASSSYIYTVSAYDKAGNSSALSTPATAFTLAQGAMATVNLHPVSDTYLATDASAKSTNATLVAYTWPPNHVADSILMKFDLRGIPTNATIQNAILVAYLVGSDNTTDIAYTITLHKIINRNPDLARATGMTYDGINRWTPSSCCYNNIPMGQADISPPYDRRPVNKTLGYKPWNMIALTQEWVRAPASNYGLMLNADTSKGANRYRSFASMENPNPTIRPQLFITYSMP